MSIVQGIVGTQQLPDSSNPVSLSVGQQADGLVSEMHARYYERTARNKKFSGSIVGQVTTVGLATTYTGLCLSNPISSSVNLVIDKVGISFIVAFAAGAHVGLMTGYNISTNVTHTAAVTVRSQRFVGSTATGSGLLDSSATLPTAPTVNTIFGSGLTGAITTAPFVNGLYDLEGSIVLPAGAYCAIYTSTASGAAAGGFSFSWEEVPAIAV